MPADPKTLADRAYQLLRQDIIDARLQPGEKLRVGHLRATYGIGASPLREALSRLLTEGFVVGEGQRGFRVAPVSPEDLREVGNLRSLLEGEVLRLAIAAGDEAWEAEVVAAFYRLSKIQSRQNDGESAFPAEWPDRSREFLDALGATCRSQRLLHLRAMIRDQHRRYANLLLSDATGPGNDEGEMRAIMEASIARDADAASQLLAASLVKATEAMAGSARLAGLSKSGRRRRRRQPAAETPKPVNP